MLSERDIEAAHPEAFDFAFGNLPSAKRPEFNRHLLGCSYCQAVVDEYSEVGRIIKLLPPHVEPAADLEERTVAAMVDAMDEGRAQDERPTDAEDRTATRVYPIPQRRPRSATDAETEIRPIPELHHPPEDKAPVYPVPEPQLDESPTGQPVPPEPPARPVVTGVPMWRRHPRRLAAVLAVAAAVIVAAIVVPLSVLGRNAAVATVVIRLHATAAAKVFGVAAATARATAHQADQSWTFTLDVHGLKPLPGNDFYECWWVTPGHIRLLATGGSFVVGNSGSTTVTMTTGVDPTQQFTTMEITAESPSKDGALSGPVLLIS
jgi:hypothetical protein